MGPYATDEDIEAVLTTTKTWAVVGCSPSPYRDSHRIARLLQDEGYTVLPVNPNVDEALGVPCHPTLEAAAAAAGGAIDVVDIFRRPVKAGPHVDEAIAIGAQAVWLQLGVIDDAAAERARAAGLRVVMDRCPAIELPRLRRREQSQATGPSGRHQPGGPRARGSGVLRRSAAEHQHRRMSGP